VRRVSLRARRVRAIRARFIYLFLLLSFRRRDVTARRCINYSTQRIGLWYSAALTRTCPAHGDERAVTQSSRAENQRFVFLSESTARRIILIYFNECRSCTIHKALKDFFVWITRVDFTSFVRDAAKSTKIEMPAA